MILPLGLFIVGIAAIAFIVQNLPSWRTAVRPSAPPPAPTTPGQALLTFPEAVALWYPGEEAFKDYYLEIEQGQNGYYDFPFYNESKTPAELSLQGTSCDCSKVKACVLAPAEIKAHKERQALLDWRGREPTVGNGYDWKDLSAQSSTSVLVPPGQGGLVRLLWSNRKQPGEALHLTLTMWSQPEGVVKDRLTHPLQTLVVVRNPVSFYPDRVNVGPLVPQSTTRKEFWCWTSTRDTLEVMLNTDKLSPCFAYDLHPLNPDEVKSFQEKLLAEGIPTKVKAACKVAVEIAEQRDGGQLDMGPLHHQAALQIWADGEKLDVPTPVVEGWVRSDVRVGGSGDRDVINLGSFRTGSGTKKDAVLFTDKGTQLKYLGHEPPFLQVKLKHKEQVASENIWDLKVTVPADAQEGPLPEGSVVLLESVRGNGEVRRVRVPVSGTALSN